MRVADFDYYLPPELIAQRPLPRRDESRLLWLDRATETLSHRRFGDLPDLLKPGDVLVLNQSKVIPARLRGRKSTGGRVELLLVKPLDEATWQAMTHPGLKPGQEISFGEAGDFRATVTWIEEDGLRRVRFDRSGLDLRRAIDAVGEMPTPPYVREPLRSPEEYQTVYASVEGSVAAPTAGLHFTEALLSRLRDRGFQLEFVTLHVGLGTFQPVKADLVSEHRMHAELCQIEPEVARRLTAARDAGRRLVAVGTTSVRTIESAADAEGRIRPFAGETSIFLYPGYHFKAVDVLITNFHLPRSTLLMLVSAFAGREPVLRAYAEAVERRYRFFSFGDAMLIT